MKCFNHPGVDAVGICKSCQKGLCPGCAVDLSKGLACKGRCEDDVGNIVALIDQNVRLSPTSASVLVSHRRTSALAHGFALVMGLVFVVWGIVSPWQPFNFALIMGSLFAVYGLVQLIRAGRLVRPTRGREIGRPAT